MPTVSNKARARFELRRLKIATVEDSPSQEADSSSPQRKRQKRRQGGSPTSSDDEHVTPHDIVQVVRLAWVEDSLRAGKVLNYRGYLVHEAVKAPHERVPKKSVHTLMSPRSPEELLRRARQVAANSSQPTERKLSSHKDARQPARHAPPLLPQSTTEEDVLARLPPIPAYLRTTYSCQRSTVVHPPNEDFIEKLKEVRELRKITGDEIGVRAYSSAIASLSAYPYKLQSAIGVYSPRPDTCAHIR